MTDRAVQMREAAANVASRWYRAAEKRLEADPDNERHEEQMAVAGSIEAAIRALPLPPQPALADDVAGVVESLRPYVAPYSHLDEAVQRNLAVAVNVWAIRRATDLIEQLAMERDRYLRHLTAGAEGLNEYKDRAEKAEAEVERLQGLLNKTAANNRPKARALRGRKGADHG